MGGFCHSEERQLATRNLPLARSRFLTGVWNDNATCQSRKLDLLAIILYDYPKFSQ